MTQIQRNLCLCLLVLLWPLLAQAQTLTEEQYQTLRNDVLVTHQAEFAAAVAAGYDKPIADAYNALQAPTFWVWKTSVTEQDIYESTSPDAAAPTWNWATFKGQQPADRDAWDTMMHPGRINPSLKQTRDAFSVIFGTQGASATQNAFLLALSRRPARRIEALLFVPTLGNGSAATPANMGYEGTITDRDIAHALRGVPFT